VIRIKRLAKCCGAALSYDTMRLKCIGRSETSNVTIPILFPQRWRSDGHGTG